MADDNKQVDIESRKDAIAAAVAVADKEAAGETETPVEEPKVEKAEEKKPEEKKEELDPEALLDQQGKDLIRALQDPTKARAVAQYLADAYGITKKDIPVSKGEDVKELRDDILEDLKDGLGEEFSVVAERLAPALTKILNKKVDEKVADIRENLIQQEREKTESQTAAAFTKYTEDFFGTEELPKEVGAEISKFMDKFQPTPDMSIKEYVKDAFDYATGKLGLTKTTKEEREKDKAKQERTNRNRTDASSRLASERAPGGDVIRNDSKPMTRQEAIKAAILAADKG